jgi:hypothetical protein
MLERLFAEMPGEYRPGVVVKPLKIYFAVDDIRKTVSLTAETCKVEAGKTTEQADCVCKIGSELLLRIWNEGYQPGVGDFLSGKIRSNNPAILQDFLVACHKAG